MSALLSDARLRTCLYATRSLGQKNIKVACGESAWVAPHFTDFNKILTFKSKYCTSRFFYPHFGDEDTFVPYMETIARHFDAFIPINEDTIIPISKFKDKFPNTLLPDYSDLQIALDKGRLMNLCQKIGIPTPRTFYPKNIIELENISDRIKFPVFIKWRTEAIGYPRYRISLSKMDLVSNYKLMSAQQEQPIVQEQISGFGAGFFGLFNRQHELKAFFIHKRLREYPITGGPSSCCESFWDEHIFEYGLKLFKALNWVGVGMVEFKWDSTDDIPKVLEVNPRFWGSTPLATISGVDFPFLLFKLVNEDFEPILSYKTGVKCHFRKDFRAIIEMMRKDKKKLHHLNELILSSRLKCPDVNLGDPLSTAYLLRS